MALLGLHQYDLVGAYTLVVPTDTWETGKLQIFKCRNNATESVEHALFCGCVMNLHPTEIIQMRFLPGRNLPLL